MRAMNYPSRRHPGPPVLWYARAGATIDDAPLPPKTSARTRAIRRVFLEDCHGRATITQVGDRADDLGLLDDFSTHRSAYEAIMRALRPVASAHPWATWLPPPHVSPPSPPG
jgi:hypothetical protein